MTFSEKIATDCYFLLSTSLNAGLESQGAMRAITYQSVITPGRLG